VFRFTDGSGRDAAAAGCLATGFRALNAVPAVNDRPPGWVTPLDLPLIRASARFADGDEHRPSRAELANVHDVQHRGPLSAWSRANTFL